MKLIQSISSTLKTWAFKNRLLKFSDRYRRDPLACFYCPEMCRFSCPVAESLRIDTVTPRGKMSLLHLAERGYSAEQVAGSEENRQWVLEQCTGCGRCTEFCKWENDVASNLRAERALHFSAHPEDRRGYASPPAPGAGPGHGHGHGPPMPVPALSRIELPALLHELHKLKGVVLFCEPGRKLWWERKLSEGWEELAGIRQIVELELPHKQWSWGQLSDEETRAIGKALSGCSMLWMESGEAAWFLAKGVKDEQRALKPEVRLVWQKLFPRMAAVSFAPDVSFHESFYFGRLFPRLGVSIPMYERGFMPFHSGWNLIDCGGESYYRYAHFYHALEMANRFMADLKKDGRVVSKIVCQSLCCVEHLRPVARVPVTYWLDELEAGRQ